MQEGAKYLKTVHICDVSINVGGFRDENSPHFAQGQFDQSWPGELSQYFSPKIFHLNSFQRKTGDKISLFLLFFCDQKPFMLSQLKERKDP